MVTRLLNLPKPPHPDDVADALAVAICTTHAADSRMWGGTL
ncbi:MAG: crossover junction endodeoxyribonuclease RuvC, partial [Selenomonadales bacterium]|nr:crossover junction endodeoxyribonuclease RuvC [Selenomonadales bacterium]